MPAHNYPRPLDARVAAIVGQLSADGLEAYWERASIREMDGMLERIDAEREALLDIFARYGVLRSTPVCLLRTKMHGAARWFVTVDVERARQQLAEQGACDIAAVDLVEALTEHFDRMAELAVLPADGGGSM